MAFLQRDLLVRVFEVNAHSFHVRMLVYAYVLTLTRVLQCCTARSPARIAHRCLSESCLAFRFKCPIHPSCVTSHLTTPGESPSPVPSGPSRTSLSGLAGVQDRAPCAALEAAGRAHLHGEPPPGGAELPFLTLSVLPLPSRKKGRKAFFLKKK